MPAASSSSALTGRAIAQAGNAVALFALVLVLVNSSRLFTAHAPPATPAESPVRTQRVLLVVVDGLRADAVTPALMPRVHALGAGGTSKTSVVGALIPSTVAGLRALIEGKIIPPGEFVNDFRARSAPQGGLLEAVHSTGGRIFTAGPHLWADLYDRWIDGKLTVFGLVRDDAAVLRAARAACADPQWKMVVVQFCRPDVTAHLHGATSREYLAGVTWCDEAIGELVRAAGKGTLVVITSDHGVTDAGGHAGTEPSVIRTPLVTNDPSFAADLQAFSQAQVPYLIASALGLRLAEKAVRPGFSPVPETPPICLLAILAGGFALLHLLGSAAIGSPPRNAAFWLNASVWFCLPLAWLSSAAAALTALGVLILTAWRYPGRKGASSLVLASGAGMIFGAIRIALPILGPSLPNHAQVSALGIATVCLAALTLGYSVGSAARQASISGLIWTGFAIATAAPLLSLLLGESVSLSTLDVRLAFRMIETPLGLPGAVLLAALRPFLPLLFLVTGVVGNWRSIEEARAKFSPVAAGAGAAIAGELACAAILLSFGASQTLSSLALGLLLRECANIAILFPALAFAALLLRRRTGHLHQTCPRRELCGGG